MVYEFRTSSILTYFLINTSVALVGWVVGTWRLINFFYTRYFACNGFVNRIWMQGKLPKIHKTVFCLTIFVAFFLLYL